MAEVEIYTTTYCGYCSRAKAFMEKKSIPFNEVNLDEQPDKYGEMLSRAEGRRSVPQIFINGKGIGGCDDLFELAMEGKLNELLTAST